MSGQAIHHVVRLTILNATARSGHPWNPLASVSEPEISTLTLEIQHG
jgi:hypothetical protein